jgi:hypothetical protein
MTHALNEARRIIMADGIMVLVFAHKETAAWEALLSAVVNSGWVITGSWPIDTENARRLRAQGSATLESSIHLVCRPRIVSETGRHIGDWRDVLRELPERIHEWMPRLAAEGVVGADAIFACLGPALEVFSKYEHVERASGERVGLGAYLEHVWAAVAREALSMVFGNADASGFEPDARVTAMWLWTISTSAAVSGSDTEDIETEEELGREDAARATQSAPNASFSLEFDAARKIAQGLGADLSQLGYVVEVRGDTARLLSVSERRQFLFGNSRSAQSTPPKSKRAGQTEMFAEAGSPERDAHPAALAPTAGATVLDRIHQAMILFGLGRSDALQRFLSENGIGNEQSFWQLAQALSALYPVGTTEKRWLDGVLARKKSLGF